MPTATAADLSAALTLYRNTHAGATRLAARIWPLVNDLRKCRMWLPRDAMVNYLASAIWGNGGYDACVNYASPDDFAVELRPDVDEGWREREMVRGVEHYVLRPFFNEDLPFLTEAGLSSLRACSLKEIAALNVSVRERSPAVPVTGVTSEEMTALISLHKASTLTIVNKLRYLATALTYPTNAMARWDGVRREVSIITEPGVSEKLAALTLALAMPGVEPPLNYFGSEWDVKSRIRDLSAGSPLAEYLLRC